MVTLAPTPRVVYRAHRPSQPARIQAWQIVAIAVVWLTCLVVATLWIAGGGVQGLMSLDAESLASLSRLTGLVSANLLLLQVLLMARVPVFERGFGHSGITRMHRLTGIWSFLLLLAHIALIIVAYALQDGANLVIEAWNVVWNYPGVLLAAVGVIVLVLVMATSARRVRRRLRYESWHLLHLYAYLGVGLAIPHMLLTGSDFLTSAVATVYWWTLWGVAATCVLVFRLALPLWRSLRHGLQVIEVVADGSRGVTVKMRGRDLDRLGARAGQHFVWRFRDGAGWSRGHPFSLSAAPTGEELQISARIVGDGTARLVRLASGTRVLIEGPYGRMTGAVRTAPRLLMLGAGAGVAPLVALLEAEPFSPGEAVIVTRDRTSEEAMRGSAIQRLIAERGLTHYALTGHRAQSEPAWLPEAYTGWSGPDLLRYLAPGGEPDAITACDVYLCGPDAWMRSVQRDLRHAGVAQDRIHAEHFTTDRQIGATP